MCCIRAAQSVCAKSMIKASVCTFGIGYLLIEMSISLDDTNEEYLINIGTKYHFKHFIISISL